MFIIINLDFLRFERNGIIKSYFVQSQDQGKEIIGTLSPAYNEERTLPSSSRIYMSFISEIFFRDKKRGFLELLF